MFRLFSKVCSPLPQPLLWNLQQAGGWTKAACPWRRPKATFIVRAEEAASKPKSHANAPTKIADPRFPDCFLREVDKKTEIIKNDTFGVEDQDFGKIIDVI